MGRRNPAIVKQCVICGTSFKVYPSESSQQCCSKKCGAALRARHGKAGGSAWSEEAKRRRSNDQQVQEQIASLQPIGMQAAMRLPEGQKGPQNRESLVWVLIDPAGGYHKAVGLADWARENRLLFFPPSVPNTVAAVRIVSGFRAIASTLRGKRQNSRPALTYKGWRLAGLPEPKKPEDNNFDNKITEATDGGV